MAQRFNLYNFCSNFQMKAALTGVYHDSGYKIASDAIVLAAIKTDYPEDMEHHIITKEGTDVPAKYPNWKSCIPDGVDYEPYDVDLAKYEAFIKERRQAWKKSTGHGTKWQADWAVQVGPAYLRAKNFDKIVAGMKEIGATQLYVKDARRTVYAKTDKGVVMFFPILYYTKENDANCVTLS